MADVSRFPEGTLNGPFVTATARPIGTIAIISDGANPGKLHRSTSYPVAGWTLIEGGGGGGETLAQTLALGNETGGYDLVVTSGDRLVGADAVGPGNINGDPIVIRGGAPSGTGGIGAIQADTAGNARGRGAVDLQQARGAKGLSGVAVADYSTIAGGFGNRIGQGDVYSFVVGALNESSFGNYGNAVMGQGNSITTGTGGYGNIVAGAYHTFSPGLSYISNNAVFGFSHNLASSYMQSNIIAGRDITLNSSANGHGYNAIFGRLHNINSTSAADYTTRNIISGNTHTTQGGLYNSAIFGNVHTIGARADYSLVAGDGHTVNAAIKWTATVGRSALAHTENAFFIGTQRSQAGISPCSAINSAAPVLSPVLNIPTNRVVAIHVVANAVDIAVPNSAAWFFNGLVQNNGGVVTIIGSWAQDNTGAWVAGPGPIAAPIATAGAAAWTMTLSISGTTLRLVGGGATVNTEWSARIAFTEAIAV